MDAINLYNYIVIFLTMTINGAINRRTGPGGGTRRLHHKIPGGEIGSTGVEKRNPSFGIVPP